MYLEHIPVKSPTSVITMDAAKDSPVASNLKFTQELTLVRRSFNFSRAYQQAK